MTIPPEYGGHGRSALERYVVAEELLAGGAPVAAHWVADRQVAPNLLRYGSTELKRRYLPGIARSTCYFAVGLSEPDAGSDLAAVRTTGTRVDGGWIVSGVKIWTSGAHRAHALIALVRTSPADGRQRHAGLSQLLIERDQPGVTIRPIISMTGEHHFNEVLFSDVFVPDGQVVGTIGAGWAQVTSELAYERSGADRNGSCPPFPCSTRWSASSRRGMAAQAPRKCSGGSRLGSGRAGRCRWRWLAPWRTARRRKSRRRW